MTLRERYLTALGRSDVPDRVPLMLEAFHVGHRDDLAAHPDPLWREVAERAYDHVPLIKSYSPGLNRYLVTPPQRIRRLSRTTQGGRTTTSVAIETPKGSLTAVSRVDESIRTTWQIKYPVETLSDIEAIASVPWERPPGIDDRPTLAADDRTIRRLHISSPMVCVAGMMPYTMFLELCATHPDLLDRLTGICLARTMDVLDVVLERGDIDVVWIGGCEWITPPMASPRTYERYVQGPEKALIERIHRAGMFAHIHCHGNVRETIEMVIERGGDYFEPVEPPPDGDLTMAAAKRLAAGRIVLGGNVEARVLEQGDSADVESAVRAAFEGGGRHMALATSAGPLTRLDPRTRDNYLLMLDLWEELSPLR